MAQSERQQTASAFVMTRLALAASLFAALLHWPYTYYTLLRFAVCVVGAYAAYVAAERRQHSWMWAFGVTALLFNPFLPVRLDRATWAVLDVAAGVLFLTSLGNRILAGQLAAASRNSGRPGQRPPGPTTAAGLREENHD